MPTVLLYLVPYILGLTEVFYCIVVWLVVHSLTAHLRKVQHATNPDSCISLSKEWHRGHWHALTTQGLPAALQLLRGFQELAMPSKLPPRLQVGQPKQRSIVSALLPCWCGGCRPWCNGAAALPVSPRKAGSHVLCLAAAQRIHEA